MTISAPTQPVIPHRPGPERGPATGPAAAAPRRGRIALRLAAWTRRYGPLELAGTAGALGAAWATHAVTGSLAAAAVAGTAGENAGYYGLALLEAVRRHAGRAGGEPAGALAACRRAASDLAVEFGPAELLDTLWARPALMYLMGAWLGVGLGMAVGKLAADVVFYAVAIGCRALAQRRMPAPPEGGHR